jgi:hypothetical protein
MIRTITLFTLLRVYRHENADRFNYLERILGKSAPKDGPIPGSFDVYQSFENASDCHNFAFFPVHLEFTGNLIANIMESGDQSYVGEWATSRYRRAVEEPCYTISASPMQDSSIDE